MVSPGSIIVAGAGDRKCIQGFQDLSNYLSMNPFPVMAGLVPAMTDHNEKTRDFVGCFSQDCMDKGY